VRIEFWGAAGTVTGSRHALFLGERILLVDCGLYQGLKELRLRNWAPLPVPASRISDVIVTHAHIDHTGYLPRLVKDGFRGRIWATPATADLMRIMLPDTGRLQEEETWYANRKGYSRHHPARALFTEEDARRVFPLIHTVDYRTATSLGDGISFVFHDAGHILGSAMCHLQADPVNILFSGDIGRPNAPIIQDPSLFRGADYLVFETTYGDRIREPVSAKDELATAVSNGLERGGAVVIPAFAVERTQELLYLLDELQSEGRIPTVPIYMDSPMAIEVLSVFRRHPELYDEEARQRAREHGLLALPNLHIATTVDQSKAINQARTPVIIVSSSGMAAGGRILHHLARRLPDPDSTVLLAGYQAVGTRGRTLQEGARDVKIHGERVPVRASIRTVHGLSGHADANDLLTWLGHFERAPRLSFAVHGEPTASAAIASRIERELGWSVRVPAYLERFELASDMR
jgi:metallo-beta-lactamase family protein